MKSTKFWQTIVGMVLVTALEIVLIIKGQCQYVEWYFGFMGVVMGIYNISKVVQNIKLANNDNPNDGDGDDLQ